MSTQSELIEKFKQTFLKRDLSIIEPYLAEEMTYEFLPPSVGEKITKVEWKKKIGNLFGLVKDFKLDIIKLEEYPLLAIIQTNVVIDFPVHGEFAQGILLLLNFVKDESGALKIASVTEYMDSFKVKEWKEKMNSSKPSSE